MEIAYTKFTCRTTCAVIAHHRRLKLDLSWHLQSRYCDLRYQFKYFLHAFGLKEVVWNEKTNSLMNRNEMV